MRWSVYSEICSRYIWSITRSNNTSIRDVERDKVYVSRISISRKCKKSWIIQAVNKWFTISCTTSSRLSQYFIYPVDWSISKSNFVKKKSIYSWICPNDEYLTITKHWNSKCIDTYTWNHLANISRLRKYVCSIDRIGWVWSSNKTISRICGE